MNKRTEKEIINDFQYDVIINSKNELVLERKRPGETFTERIRIDKVYKQYSKVLIQLEPYIIRPLNIEIPEHQLLHELYECWEWL